MHLGFISLHVVIIALSSHIDFINRSMWGDLCYTVYFQIAGKELCVCKYSLVCRNILTLEKDYVVFFSLINFVYQDYFFKTGKFSHI